MSQLWRLKVSDQVVCRVLLLLKAVGKGLPQGPPLAPACVLAGFDAPRFYSSTWHFPWECLCLNVPYWDFPSCPVVKIPYCQCRRYSFHLWKGTKIPNALLCDQMIKKNKIRYRVLFSSTAGWSKDLKEGKSLAGILGKRSASAKALRQYLPDVQDQQEGQVVTAD